jgi:hypothetical protein
MGELVCRLLAPHLADSMTALHGLIDLEAAGRVRSYWMAHLELVRQVSLLRGKLKHSSSSPPIYGVSVSTKNSMLSGDGCTVDNADKGSTITGFPVHDADFVKHQFVEEQGCVSVEFLPNGCRSRLARQRDGDGYTPASLNGLLSSSTLTLSSASHLSAMEQYSDSPGDESFALAYLCDAMLRLAEDCRVVVDLKVADAVCISTNRDASNSDSTYRSSVFDSVRNVIKIWSAWARNA